MGDPNRKSTHCRLSSVCSEGPVWKKFPFVLCQFDNSAPDVLDDMWVGAMWAGSMSGCMFASIEPDGRCGLAFLSLCKNVTPGHFPGNLGMDLVRVHPSGRYLTKTCFRCSGLILNWWD